VKGLAQWIADSHSPAADHMDLLTTVLHELGHVLGYDDQQAQQRHTMLMAETLPAGVRQLPSSLDVGLLGLSGLSGSRTLAHQSLGGGGSSDPNSSVLSTQHFR